MKRADIMEISTTSDVNTSLLKEVKKGIHLNVNNNSEIVLKSDVTGTGQENSFLQKFILGMYGSEVQPFLGARILTIQHVRSQQ